MKTTTRNLLDGSILTVTVKYGNYSAIVSSATRILGFEGDNGKVGEDSIDSIADELANWMYDNLNS